MALPPQPVGVPPGHSYWNDWYEKLRDLVNGAITDHNTLNNIQGGSSTERYHLTNAQHAAVSGTRITKGTDTTDDLIVDLATKGLVLKDTQATPHYWRVTIRTLGALVTTDLGTTKP